MATISSLLADHVSLQVRSVDRLFLQGYVPRLMTEGQVIRFLLDRGFPIPSPAVLGKIGRDYVNQINDYIADNEIPTVKFVKGDVKEEIARKHFQQAEREGRYGVVMVGIAQEKTSAWRGWRDGGPDGHPHFVYRRQSIFPNNYYFYIRDPDWGPAFIKTIAYAPFPVWIYLNGNEWAKQQAAQQDIGFRALDNGFASCEHPRRSPRSATACPPRMSARSSIAGRRRCPRRSPTRTASAGTATRSRSGSWRSPTPACSIGPPPAAPGSSNDPRPAHPRPPRSGGGHLRPARQPPDPGSVSHEGLQPRRGGSDPDPLPRLEGQAVLQRRPRAQDRDDHQRHPRLRDQTPPHRRELGRADRHRTSDQPAPAGPPT